MKKLIPFLLIVSLLLACTNSLAEGMEKKEILFRGIPWGSSATDFLAQMQDAKLGGSIREYDYDLYSWERKEGKNVSDHLSSIEKAGWSYSSYPKDATVAGIPIDEIDAFFLYTFDDKAIYREENKCSLYKAYYELEPVDYVATYPIL